jgi:thiamine-phosphate pyrophosphorylase
MKDTSREDYVHTAVLLREITHGTRTQFIVNDQLDVAIEVDADGVHLGQTDLSVTEARKRWNTPGKIFGLSTHSMEQACKAAELRPDYIGIGRGIFDYPWIFMQEQRARTKEEKLELRG